MNNKPISTLSWIIFISLSVIWGSSFILMKLGMIGLSANQVGALRIFLASIFMLPFAFWHVKREHIKHIPAFLGMGLFGNLIPAFLFTNSETHVSSALAGMLNSLTPLFTLTLGVLLFSVKTSWINAMGIIMGLLGAIGLAWSGDTKDISNNIGYGLLIVLATFFYGLSVNIIRKHLSEINAVTATTWALLLTGPIAGAYLFSTDFLYLIKTNPATLPSIGYTAILGIVGTAISVILFNMLIRETSALFASSVTYIIPIVAIFLGIFYGETIVWQHFMFMALILMGVWLVNKK